MTSRKLTTTLLAVAAAALSFSALAHDAGTPHFRDGRGGMLQRLDTDGDGLVSLQEFQAAGEARFAQLDADGDGYVSKAEFDALHMARFSALDANGNGVIDADERPARRGLRDGKGGRDGCARGAGKGYGKLDR